MFRHLTNSAWVLDFQRINDVRIGGFYEGSCQPARRTEAQGHLTIDGRLEAAGTG